MKPKNLSKTFLLSGLVVICINLAKPSLCNNFEHKDDNTTTKTTTTERCDNDDQQMVWSRFLEEYTVSQQTSGSRAAKVLPNPGMVNPGMMNPSTPMNFISDQNYHRYIPTNNIYITKRIGEAMELEPHMRPPAKVINPPHRQSGLPSGFGSQMQQPSHPVHPQQHVRAVSENDLYLLGAIEKLVYRVDYLESRVRRSEQLIYYLMAGNNQKEVRDPCPANFTRISDACYFINSDRQVNWKTANSACKSVNSYLAEFEKVSENEELIAHLLNQQVHRGRDFWLGGLNPGLLWIWANSAKPVNPNMNLTTIANNLQQENDNAANGGSSNKTESNQILNNTMEIKGQGRCLRLSYNPAKHSYFYYGQECTSRHHFICEYEDKTLDNKIKKISRELRLDN